MTSLENDPKPVLEKDLTMPLIHAGQYGKHAEEWRRQSSHEIIKSQIKKKIPANVIIPDETAYPLSAFCQKIIDI